MECEGHSNLPDRDVNHTRFRAVHDRREDSVLVPSGCRNNRRTGDVGNRYLYLSAGTECVGDYKEGTLIPYILLYDVQDNLSDIENDFRQLLFRKLANTTYALKLLFGSDLLFQFNRYYNMIYEIDN